MIVQVHFSVHIGPRLLAECFIKKKQQFLTIEGVAKAGTILSESVHLHIHTVRKYSISCETQPPTTARHCQRSILFHDL